VDTPHQECVLPYFSRIVQNMENQVDFILKVFLISLGLSLLIKYVLPWVPIAATATNALILVLLPTAIMAIALLLRYQTQKQN
jgi:hypothetical protein